MTILPKKKAHTSNSSKTDRYGRNVAEQHQHHRYGGASPASHSGVDVTSGAMSTSGILPVTGSSASGASSAALSSKRGAHHKFSTMPAGQSLSTSSLSAVGGGPSAGESSSMTGGVSPNSHLGKHSVSRQAPSTSKHSSNTRVSGPSASKKAESTNSDDEYGEGFRDDELEIRFAERLKKSRGFIIKDVKGDGACMFRAIADQVYGDEEMHSEVRVLCMDYIAKNRDHFSQFLTEDFDAYLERKREDDAHGNHVELQAISEIYLRPIEIYEYSMEPINTFHPISPEANTGVTNAPLRLSYHGTIHYNSVVDPFRATIGVGLGLPNFQPGLADRNLVEQAELASEAQHIEEAMLNDKLRMTDWERTEDELARQIAKESYMEYLRQQEKNGTSRRDLLRLDRTVVAMKEKEDNGVPSPFSRSDPNTTGRLTKESGAVIIGTKRGFSISAPDVSGSLLADGRNSSLGRSPNRKADGSDRRSGSLSPQPKVHRDECSASSMPNIDDENFGTSFLYAQEDLMKPSTSAASLVKSFSQMADVQLKSDVVEQQTPSSSSAAADALNKFNDSKSKTSSTATGEAKGEPSLYEELLAASAIASDDWVGSSSSFDETADIARALALSQQEFYESLANKK